MADNFWQAFSALATAIGVLVALFLPFWQEFIRNKRIIDAIRREYEEVKNRVTKIKTFKKQQIKLPTGESRPITIEQYAANMLRWIKHPLWDEYYTKLAVTKMNKDEVEKIRIFYEELDDIIAMFFNALKNSDRNSDRTNLTLAIARLKDL